MAVEKPLDPLADRAKSAAPSEYNRQTMKTVITITMLVAAAITAQAEPRDRHNRNYILRRQQAYAVQGTPTSRLIIGRREIDIYRAPGGRGHIMFEGDYMIGVTR